jgi:predicted ATPase
VLTQIEINNFRCLRKVNVPLKPLTVLIGPNDTGKSAFLAAVEKLQSPGMHAPTDYWMGNPTPKPCIAGSVGPRKVRAGPGGHDGDRTVLSDIMPIRFFYLPSTGVPMQSGGQAEGAPQAPDLDRNGQGVASLVDFFLRRDRQRFDAFVAAMKEQVLVLKDIHIGTPNPDQRRLDLKLGDDFSIPADLASAGVRLLLFFVALTYHPSPPKLILLEEPENGIHPRRLKDVVKLLRDITKGAHSGHKAQVILTTHSPYLLDCIDIENDQVLVFFHQEDGSRTAKPVNAEHLKDYLNDFMLGEIWYNKEERGLLGEKDA